MSDTTFVNVETVLRGWLATIFTTQRICSELPDDLAGALPVIQVVRASGDDPRNYLATDRALVDVDVWHNDRTSAHDLAELVRSALRFELPGTTTGGAVFSWVTTTVGPRYLPDPNPNVRRSNATYEVGLHPE